MAKGKWFVERKETRLFVGVFLRFYRWFIFGTLLMRHDRRLLDFLRSRDPAVFAVWHQDFVFTLGYLSRWNPIRKTYPLASSSRDGGMANAAAEGMGYRPAVRGSSARDGRRALLRLTRLLQADPRASVAVVCDGPRPPARELKPGILHLAQSSGRPIWLVRTSFRNVRLLSRTWARFHLPLPFKRGVCLADGPIHVPADLGREGLEALRREIEGRLNRLADRADALAART
jgi:lysophospholipid acyltransferase (LPLAT)-like uncharacterized protein